MLLRAGVLLLLLLLLLAPLPVVVLVVGPPTKPGERVMGEGRRRGGVVKRAEAGRGGVLLLLLWPLLPLLLFPMLPPMLLPRRLGIGMKAKGEGEAVVGRWREGIIKVGREGVRASSCCCSCHCPPGAT